MVIKIRSLKNFRNYVCIDNKIYVAEDALRKKLPNFLKAGKATAKRETTKIIIKVNRSLKNTNKKIEGTFYLLNSNRLSILVKNVLF